MSTVHESDALLANLQKEYDEFQQESRVLEAELEKEIELRDERIAELMAKIERLSNEKEMLHEKYRKAVEEGAVSLEKQLQAFRVSKENEQMMKTRIVHLEDYTETLEGAVRAKEASIMNLEDRMSQMLERNAFLELEVDSHRTVEESLHRLKVELSELRDERCLTKVESMECDKTTSDVCIATEPVLYSNEESSSSSFKLVEDINNKIKSLELKLSSCRDLVLPIIDSS